MGIKQGVRREEWCKWGLVGWGKTSGKDEKTWNSYGRGEERIQMEEGTFLFCTYSFKLFVVGS